MQFVKYAIICIHMNEYVIVCFICSIMGINDCLVPLTPYLPGMFKHLPNKSKLPPRVREMDMRHILLILQFLQEGLILLALRVRFHIELMRNL